MRGKDSVFVPFFGVSAATITATHHLARLSGAAVIPFFHQRKPDGGYVLRLEAPLADFPGDDVTIDTARVNACVERMVRDAPAQYLWIHKRFKTRPVGETPVY
jgi:KDO2-lipid IV(A) lauroyltransferase